MDTTCFDQRSKKDKHLQWRQFQITQMVTPSKPSNPPKQRRKIEIREKVVITVDMLHSILYDV